MIARTIGIPWFLERELFARMWQGSSRTAFCIAEEFFSPDRYVIWLHKKKTAGSKLQAERNKKKVDGCLSESQMGGAKVRFWGYWKWCRMCLTGDGMGLLGLLETML